MRGQVHTILNEKCGIKDHCALVVAVSGGPDSMCLLDLLAKLPFTLHVAHLNHKLRESADEEQEFVSRKAQEYGLSLFAKTANIQKEALQLGIGIEEAARNARYEFLFRIADKTQSAAVVAAHHADDQVETIVMNFIRGTGMTGLTGMAYRSISTFHPRIPLARPLLNFWKEDILKYCRDHELAFRVDQTNLGSEYSRNRIRNHFLPLLIEYNPNFKGTVLRNREVIERDLRYIRDQTGQAESRIDLAHGEDQISFSLEKFNSLPDALKYHILMDLLRKLAGMGLEISYQMVKNALRVFERNHQTRAAFLGQNTYVLVEGGRGILTVDPEKVWRRNWPTLRSEMKMSTAQGACRLDDHWEMTAEIRVKGETEGEFERNNDPFSAYLDARLIGDLVFLRHWKPGDVYHPLGMGGRSTKLTDFWINNKIPRRARKKWPLIEKDGLIAWIPGFHPSHRFRVRDNTQEVLLLRLLRNY